MTTTLNRVLIAVALSSLAVIACDRRQGTRMAEEQPGESAESGNTRCALVDGQVSARRQGCASRFASFLRGLLNARDSTLVSGPPSGRAFSFVALPGAP